MAKRGKTGGSSEDLAEARRKRLVEAERKTAFVTNTPMSAGDLTRPDVKAASLGVDRAKDLHYLQRWRPELPSVETAAELHVQEIAETHLADFESSLFFATQVDVVANKLLENRESYNRYLQKFDDFINDVFFWLQGATEKMAKLSDGNMTENSRPIRTAFKIGTRRGMQIHNCYVMADKMLRHASYLAIFGNLPENEYMGLRNKAVRSLRYLRINLMGVRDECFQEIKNQAKEDRFQNSSRAGTVKEERIDPHAQVSEGIVRELEVIKSEGRPRRRKVRA